MFLKNIGLALRGLRKRPAFAVTIVLVLAIGIGANTAIFTVINAAFLRPLPYEGADALVQIMETSGGNVISVSYPNYLDWRARAKSLGSLAAVANLPVLVKTSAASERVIAGYVTPSFFETMRLKPVIGRAFTSEEELDGVVLTNDFWVTRFAADRNVIGRAINVDKRACTVIGILPASFHFYSPADVYVPFGLMVDRYGMRERANHSAVIAVARRKAGVSTEIVRAEMASIAKQLEREYPGIDSGIGTSVMPLREWITGGARNALLLLMVAVGLVLFIACLNVGSLLLVRALSREKEIAIRAALGASRSQIAQQLLVEGMVLSAAGGLLGLLLASLTTSVMGSLAPRAIIGEPVSLDWRVLSFSLGVTLFTGALFAIIPILHVFRTDLSSAIRDAGRTTSAVGSMRTQNALVMVEIALSVALLSGAGLLMRSFYKLMQVQPGYNTANILSMRVSLPDSEEMRLADYPVYFDRLLTYINTLPGVEHAAGVMMMPFTGENSSMQFYLEGKPIPPKGKLPSADRHVVTAGYFQTMGIPLLRGRVFDDSDRRMPDVTREDTMKFFRGFPFSVVISDTMAKRFWPNQDPIGRRFRVGPPEFQGPWLTVIGVVGDTKTHSLADNPTAAFYFSARQLPSVSLNVVIRTASGSAMLVPAIRREASRLHPDAALTDVRSFDALIEKHVADRKRNLYLVGAFAAMALLLAAVGVYGVIAYSVAQRTHEIGIRVALGASQSRVLRLILEHGLQLSGVGLALGLAIAAALSRLLANMLFGVSSFDAVTFAAVALILATVTLMATYLPARRASAVDPLTALRSE